MSGVTIRDLISFAYAVRPERVSGGPKWLDSDVYEVIADPEPPGAEDNPTGTLFGPGTKGWSRLELRLQTLLAERCGLVIRKEEKEEAALAMVPAKGGIKLVPAPDSAIPPGTNRNAGTITGRNGTMQMLATVLTQLIGRPVIDKTGAEGGYDYKLSYADANDPNAEGPSPAVALEEQLGLRLERVRAPIATYIVERVNRPSAN
jgi:uncharacterized protein (TIGR03435 family)